jgi:hypothetical protein
LANESARNPSNQAIPDGLSRGEIEAVQAVAWPDKWASRMRLVVDAHPFDVRGREYEVAILRDEAKYIIVPKGAQLGLTTTFLTKSMHALVKRKWQVLYLLPVKAGTVTFVQGRIDPIIDANPNLKALMGRVDNRAQKQTKGGTNWYVRGTNIETELREVPADVLVLDERDKMNEDNMPHAFERLSGSPVQKVWELSTPTVDGFGVYREDGYPSTDMMKWWVPCPHCNSKQVLSFEENVQPFLGDTVEESKQSCRCSHCKGVLTDDDRRNMNAGGTWVPEQPGREVRGYYVNQLNSPTKTLADPQLGFLVNYFKGQTDSMKLKEFFNLGLGLPYAAAGDKFTVELLNSCRRGYTLGGLPPGPLFIGIDQGADALYVTSWTWDSDAKQRRLYDARIVTANGTRTKWTVLDEEVLSRHPQWLAVCDAHPDKEDAEALSKKYPGRFWMGFEKDRPEQPVTAHYLPHSWGDPCKVNIDRTMAFDSLIKNYLEGGSILPRDASELGEFMPKKAYNGFYHQHLQMVRVEQPDATGRMVARWVNGNIESAKKGQGKNPDHWHHSDMFALMATHKEMPLSVPSEIGDVFQAAGGLIAVG